MQRKIKEPIIFTAERTFGDLIGAPFQFIVQEFKPLILSLLRYAGPFFALAMLLLVIFINKITMMFQNFGSNDTEFIGYFFLFWIIMMIGVLALVSVTYAYISLYSKLGKGNFTISDVGRIFKRKIFKVFGGILLISLMVIPMAFVVMIPFIGILLFYVLFFWITVSLSFYAVIIVHEDKGVGESFSRSFNLIKGKWWFTFGLYVVFGLIVAFSSYLIMIPLMLGVFASGFTPAGPGTGTVVIIIFSVLFYFAYYFIVTALQHSLFSFQYFNLITQKEGLDLIDRIDQIAKDVDQNSFDLNEEQENKEEKGADDLIKNEEKPKTEDEWSKLLDDQEKKNRFTNDEDDIDRFKPKY